MKKGKVEVAGLVCVNGLPHLDWSNLCYGDRTSCHLPDVEDCTGSKVLMTTHTHPGESPFPSNTDITSTFTMWATGDAECECVAGKRGIFCYTVAETDFSRRMKQLIIDLDSDISVQEEKLDKISAEVREDPDLILFNDNHPYYKERDKFDGLLMEVLLVNELLSEMAWRNPNAFIRQVGVIPWEEREGAKKKLLSIIKEDREVEDVFGGEDIYTTFKIEVDRMMKGAQKVLKSAEERTGETFPSENTVHEDIYDRFKTVGLIK